MQRATMRSFQIDSTMCFPAERKTDDVLERRLVYQGCGAKLPANTRGIVGQSFESIKTTAQATKGIGGQALQQFQATLDDSPVFPDLVFLRRENDAPSPA